MNGRRALLKFLAASPLLALSPRLAEAVQTGDLEQAAYALDVFDFETAAQKVVPPAHWGYLMSGVDGDATLRANRDGYGRYQLKTRRFIPVNRVDMSIELLGARFNSPIFLSPIGSSRAFHRDGEVAVARAAQAKRQLQIMSTLSSFSIEDVVKARGGTTWYQLYTTNNFAATSTLVKRAQAAGCPAVTVTVDLPAGRNAITAGRLARTDTRDCSACHTDATGDRMRPRAAGTDMGKPMFAGLDTKNLGLTVDGGVRRGTDVLKALALGASGVGIGRPHIWGLAAFGQQGVERVLDILNAELRFAMVGCGTTSVKAITPASIIDTGRRG